MIKPDEGILLNKLEAEILKPNHGAGENRTVFQKSPLHLLIIIGLSIFVAEAIAMSVIHFLPPFKSEIIEALFDSAFLVVLVSPALYFFLFRPLLLYLTESRQTEEALLRVKDELEDKVVERTAEFKKANEQLTAWAGELEQHNRETKLLSQMVDFLQTSLSVDESYPIITQFAAKLFPEDSGALFIFRASRNLLETSAVWGKSAPEDKGFHPDECWALRRGQSHVVADTSLDLRCKHLHDGAGAYMCIPMMAHGETLGMLNLVLSSSNPENSKEYHIDAKRRLLTSMAEHIGLAIANLKLRETLRGLSIRDSLTGLFNRRYLEESLEREQYRSERNKTPLGIIMIDIDHFKRFNDTYGHDAGDAVLHAIGLFLQQNVRGSDIACRYGGEEFVLILTEASIEVTRQRAEHLCEAVKKLQVQYDHQPLAVTFSLGLAVFPDHGSTVHAVLQAADAALYRAKEEGRDRVCAALVNVF